MTTPLWVLPLILLAVLVALFGGLWAARWLASRHDWRSPIRYRTEPVPPEWEAIVRRNIPLAARLPEEDFDRLMKITQVFLDSKRIEGAGGLEMTEEIAVTVAAQASFLLLWLEVGCYPSLSTVIVYPGTVRQKRSRIGRGVDLGPEHEALIAGESWRQGIVVLTWDATRHGAYHPDDGQNVVFHEFAHQLDQETGDSDGTPVGLKLRALEAWGRVMEGRLEYLRDAVGRDVETVMRPYGTTNRAEFFAVATEAFFERPFDLAEAEPDLHELMVDFYGVDPTRHPGWADG